MLEKEMFAQELQAVAAPKAKKKSVGHAPASALSTSSCAHLPAETSVRDQPPVTPSLPSWGSQAFVGRGLALVTATPRA